MQEILREPSYSEYFLLQTSSVRVVVFCHEN